MINDGNRIRIGHNVTIYRRGKRGLWCAEYWRNGQHCRQSLKTTNKKVAVQRGTKLSTELTDGTYVKAPMPVAVGDVSDDYIAFLETKGRARKTITKYKSTLELLVNFLIEHRVTKLGGFTEAHFDKFRATRLADHHRKTVYCETIIIKQLLKWAKKRKLILENPLAEYEVEKPPHEEHACPSLEQVNRILAALEAKRIPQVAILAFTGMRAGELQRLKPEDIDLTGRWLNIRSRVGGETKNRKSRKVPIHDRLLPTLRALPSHARPFVFSEPPSKKYPNGDHHLNVKRLNEAFQEVVKRLGFVTGRKNSGLVLHSLRHFFETIGVNAGVPQRAVDNWMGHAPDRSMASIYYKLDGDESQRFMKTVPFGEGALAADTSKKE
jgi:integrase